MNFAHVSRDLAKRHLSKWRPGHFAEEMISNIAPILLRMSLTTMVIRVEMMDGRTS
jgi:hypothetical protein